MALLISVLHEWSQSSSLNRKELQIKENLGQYHLERCVTKHFSHVFKEVIKTDAFYSVSLTKWVNPFPLFSQLFVISISKGGVFRVIIPIYFTILLSTNWVKLRSR